MADLFDRLSQGSKDILQRSLTARSSSILSSINIYNAFFTNSSFFETESEDNAWFEIVLLNDSFILHSYSITSNSHGNDDFPQQWNFIGSTDGRKWHELSDVTDSKLKEKGQTVNYPVKRFLPLRFFRLIMKGTNYKGGKMLCIERIYFYGQTSYLTAKSNVSIFLWRVFLCIILS